MNEDHIFDLIVIGTGTAASAAAHECSSAGWKVSIIDSLSFGGTCALRGCEPNKIHVKWSDLIRFKRTFTEPFPKHREEGYKKVGIVPFHGHARFIGSNAVKVEGEEENGSSNKNAVLNGKKFLVATGANPMPLNIPGSANIITS